MIVLKHSSLFLLSLIKTIIIKITMGFKLLPLSEMLIVELASLLNLSDFDS